MHLLILLMYSMCIRYIRNLMARNGLGLIARRYVKFVMQGYRAHHSYSIILDSRILCKGITDIDHLFMLI